MKKLKRKMKRLLAITLALCMSIPSQVFAIDLTTGSGLYTYLQFEDEISDSSEKGKGILYSSSSYNLGTLTYEEGINGKAVRVPQMTTGNASAQVIRLNNGIIEDRNSSSVWSLSMWIKPEDLTNDTAVFYSRRTNQSTYLIPGGLSGGKMTPTLRIEDRGGGTQPNWDLAAPESLALDEWAMLTVTNDKRLVKFYVNGQLAAQQDITGIQYAPIGSASQTYYIGGDDVNGSFDGLMDDFMLYDNVALTQEQIRDIFEEQRNGADILTSIEITAKPDKEEYTYRSTDEEFDPTGLVVSKVFSDGTTEELQSGEYDIDSSGLDTSSLGEKEIKVTACNKTVTFTVKVVSNSQVSKIEIAAEPDKTVYYVGEEFDSTGLELEVEYEDDSSASVTAGFEVSGFDSRRIGSKQITITYGGMTAAFNVEIKAINLSAAGTGNTIGLYTYLQFEDEIRDISDKGKGVLYSSSSYNLGTLTYEEGINGKAVRVPKVTTGDARAQVIRLANGIITSDWDTSMWSLSMWVKPEDLTSDTAVFYSARTDQSVYLMPGGLSDGKMVPTLRIEDRGATRERDYWDLTAPESMGLTVDEWAMLTVTYDKYMVRFYVNGQLAVEQDITGICYAPIGSSSQTYYIGGDNVNGSFDGLIDGFMLYNTIALTDDQVYGIFEEQLADGKVLVGIEADNSNGKAKYTLGDPLDTSELIVHKVYSDGSKAAIDAGDYEVSGYNGMAVGQQTITVTAYNKTAAFGVEVAAGREVTGISIESLPQKTVYYLGDSFDATGLAIKITYEDETSISMTTGFELSGFDSTQIGVKTIKTTYEGEEDAFDVIVLAVNPTGSTLRTYLKFEGNLNDSATGTTATGITKSGNITYAQGLDGQAVRFHSSGTTGNDVIQLANGLLGTTATISLWVKPDADTLKEDVAVFHTKRTWQSISIIPGGLAGGNGAPVVRIYDGGDNNVAPHKEFYDLAAPEGMKLTENEWAMLTLTYANYVVTLYINGEEAASMNLRTSASKAAATAEDNYISFVPIGSGSQEYYIGAGGAYNSDYATSTGITADFSDSDLFEGLIDNFMCYTATLTADQVYGVFEEQQTAIEITEEPAKKVYQYQSGEAFDPAGLVVTQLYSNGTKQVLESDEYKIDSTGFSTSRVGDQEIKVTVGIKTVTFIVTVVSVIEITGIKIAAEPTKTAYYLGESFDGSGLELEVEYEDGTSALTTTGFTVSGFDSNTVGTQTITVTYQEKTAAFDVEVKAIDPTDTILRTYLKFEDNLSDSATGTAATGITKSGNISYEEGLDGQAVRFNNSTTTGNDVIQLANGLLGTTATVSLWVKPDADTLKEDVAVFYTKRTYQSISIMPGGVSGGNGTPTVRIYDVGDPAASGGGLPAVKTFYDIEAPSSMGLTEGEWAMLTLKYANYVLTFYVNGEEAASMNLRTGDNYICYAPIGSGSQEYYIGAGGAYNGDYATSTGITADFSDSDLFEGLIDNFMCYTSALTEGQIKNIFAEQLADGKVLVGIEADNSNGKSEYDRGETFDSTGLLINKVFSDATKEEIAGTDYVISNDFNSNIIGVQTLTVTAYNKTATFDVRVNRVGDATATSLEITKNPAKTTFGYGADLDLSGMEIKMHYDDGTYEMLEKSEYNVEGYDRFKVGEQELTISSVEQAGITTTLAISVNETRKISINFDNESNENSIMGSSAGLHASTSFNLGDYTYANGISGKAVKIGTKSSSTAADLIRLTDNFLGQEDDYTFSLWVNPSTLSDGEVAFFARRSMHSVKILPGGVNNNGKPTVRLYNANQSANTYNMVSQKALTANEWAMLTITSVNKKIYLYINGELACDPRDVSGWDYRPIASTGSMRFYIGGLPEYDEGTGYGNIVDGETAHIFDGQIDEFLAMTNALSAEGVLALYAEQQKEVESIRLETTPTKRDYFTGEQFDSEGMEVIARWEDGSERVITDYTISGFNSDAEADEEQTVTVSYKGVSTTFKIQMTLTKIEELIIMALPNKVGYQKGESLSTNGLAVQAVYNNGTSQTIKDFEISGYDKDLIGVQTITITYQGKTATFTVTVTDGTGMSILKYPNKTVYYLGESFDATGLIVNLRLINGENKDIEDYTISGFDSSTVGKKVITVTYGELTATFEVSIVKPTLVLDRTSATLYTAAGNQVTIKVTNITGPSNTVTWNSSASTIATVKNGVVTAKKAGTAKITASANGISASVTITVRQTKLKLNQTKATLYTRGKKTITLKVTSLTGPTSGVVWKSNKTSVAKVSKKGKVTAQKAGTAKITATANGVSAVVQIKVRKPSMTVKNGSKALKNKAAITVNLGKKVTLKVNVKPKASVAFSSKNTKIAKISKKGVITGVGKGSTSITVKSKSLKLTKTFTVSVR